MSFYGAEDAGDVGDEVVVGAGEAGFFGARIGERHGDLGVEVAGIGGKDADAIRENTEFGKAIMVNKTIFQQELRASGAEDYASLAAEVIARLALDHSKQGEGDDSPRSESPVSESEVGVN